MTLADIKKIIVDFFKNLNCKSSCFSSCCNDTEIDIQADIDGDGKKDLDIHIKDGEINIKGSNR